MCSWATPLLGVLTIYPHGYIVFCIIPYKNMNTTIQRGIPAISKDRKALIHRLSRIQGQIEALKRSIEEDDGRCLTNMRQVKAIRSGVKSFAEEYVQRFARSCGELESVSPRLRRTMEEVVASAFIL